MRGTGGVIKDLRYVVHVLLLNSFLAQRGHFFSWEPLDQLEISALKECELTETIFVGLPGRRFLSPRMSPSRAPILSFAH